jgi:hypothetical protein
MRNFKYLVENLQKIDAPKSIPIQPKKSALIFKDAIETHDNPHEQKKFQSRPPKKKIQVKSPMWAQKLMKVQGQVNKLRLMSFLWRKLGVTFHCLVLFVQQLNRWY